MLTSIISDPLHLMTHSSPSLTVFASIQKEISNGYQGSFIISMAYQSHSDRGLFICQEMNDAAGKTSSKSNTTIVKPGAFYSTRMTGSYKAISCLHALGYYKTFIQ